MNAPADAIFALVLLAAVPTAIAVLLRWAGMTPGPAAIMGGIAGGILLGPLVLGRVQPEIHERLFLGGIEEHRQLDHLLRLRGAEELAARAAGVQTADRTEADERFRMDRVAASEALAAGRLRDQWRLRAFAAALCAVMLPALAWRPRRGVVQDAKAMLATVFSAPAKPVPAMAIARWCAPALIATALVRVGFDQIALIPIGITTLASIVAASVFSVFLMPRAIMACLAVVCTLAAWNAISDATMPALVLAALLMEGLTAIRVRRALERMNSGAG